MRLPVLILLTLTTLFHAVTGLSSGGRVLCMGSGEHAAIEGRHHGQCPAVAEADAEGHGHDHDVPPAQGNGRPDDGPVKTCVDLVVAGDTDGKQLRVSVPDHDVLSPSSPLAPPAAWLAAGVSASAHPSWAGPPGDSPACSSLGRLATLVLLI